MRTTLKIAALVGLVAVAGEASAASFNVSRQPGALFANASSTVDWTLNGNDDSSSGGQFRLTGDNGFGDFLAWCIELTDFLVGANPDSDLYHVNPTTIADPVARGNVQKLFDTAYGGLDYNNGAQMAGFQAALWEVRYDTTLDLSGGAFVLRNTNAVRTAAQGFIDGLAAPTGQVWNLTYLESAEGQDLVTATPVPLPAAGWMLVAGLGGLAALRRRR